MRANMQKQYASSVPAAVAPQLEKDSSYPDSDTSSEASLSEQEYCNG